MSEQRPASLMERELAEIPAAAARFLRESRDAVSKAAAALRAADPTLLATVARGSSDHAATYLKYAVELVAGVPVASLGPSIASVYGRPLRLGGAACIGISQSGQSPDLVRMIEAAASGGALTLAITNDPESPMAGAASHCLALGAGPERSVAATKTFVVSVLAGLALLAEWQRDEELCRALEKLPQALAQALALDWQPLVARLGDARQAYVLGRGPAYAIAREAALKCKEVAGIHAEAYSTAEVLHGPAAIVGGRFPILALGVADAALPQIVATASRLAGQGADLLLTGAAIQGATRLPAPPPLHPLLDPLVLAVSFYRAVEALARARGLDPDTPPHLRKVTETL